MDGVRPSHYSQVALEDGAFVLTVSWVLTDLAEKPWTRKGTHAYHGLMVQNTQTRYRQPIPMYFGTEATDARQRYRQQYHGAVVPQENRNESWVAR